MTTETFKPISNWVIIVSGVFALMELLVSISLWYAPQSVLETVDLKASGVNVVVNMWAGRQFALGVIFAFATFRKSIPMLTIAYLFFLIMFITDFVVGYSQHELSLMISSTVMCLISALLLFVLNKR